MIIQTKIVLRTLNLGRAELLRESEHGADGALLNLNLVSTSAGNNGGLSHAGNSSSQHLNWS